MASNSKTAAPSFDDCAGFIGAGFEDPAFSAFLKAHKFGKREKMDAVEGEPRAAYVRNEKLGVIFDLEDDIVVGFTLESTVAPGLPGGVAFGAARADVAKAWGKPVEVSKRHDTFQRALDGRKQLRVTCTFIRDALDDVHAEIWTRQVERENREGTRIEESIAAPAGARDVKALPAKWKKLLPDVSAMVALFGKSVADPSVAKVVGELGLELQASGDDGMLTGPEVHFGINGGQITSAAIFGGWGGGLEGGLQNGKATRAEVRALLGKPARATEQSDYFKKDGMRRSVTYIDGVVLCWSVEQG